MTKILLVEDDKSLREIYGVRLLAEGYDIVSAEDGETALAMAIKERPSLIIADVMMPKISGFDMLDILRSTTETRDVKVIIMTALGSDENKARGEQLGADLYLVKSQVGIEDVVQAVHDLLGDQSGSSQPQAAASVSPAAEQATSEPQQSQSQSQQQQPQAPSQPSQFAPTPPNSTQPQTTPSPQTPTSTPAPSAPAPTIPATSRSAVPQMSRPTQPQTQAPAQDQRQTQAQTTQPQTLSDNQAPEPQSRKNRVIQPINDPSKQVDIQALLDKELAKEAAAPPQSTEEEKAVVDGQINDFASKLPSEMPATPNSANEVPEQVEPSQSNQEQNTPTPEGTAPAKDTSFQEFNLPPVQATEEPQTQPQPSEVANSSPQPQPQTEASPQPQANKQRITWDPSTGTLSNQSPSSQTTSPEQAQPQNSEQPQASNGFTNPQDTNSSQ